jgi:hypothetical protein
MSFITWDVEDVETGERFPYLFERERVPKEGRVVTIDHKGEKRRVRRIFTPPQQIHVKQYDGVIGTQLPTKRAAIQQGMPLAPGYDKSTGLPRFTSRAAMDKYHTQLSKSAAYGKEVRWKNSE